MSLAIQATDREAGRGRSAPMPFPPDGALASELHHGAHPDGGLRAWLVVAGSFSTLFTTYGWMQSVGTVQTYLENHQLAEFSTGDIGWIQSVFIALGTFLGILVGPVFDRRGPIGLLSIGTVLYVTHFFILAQCKVYWQFMLAQGILGGVGCAILGTTAVSIISNWFLRRRGLAIGLALSGSSCGGTVLPILLRTLFPSVGWAWSMRVIGFISLALLVLGGFCIKPNPRLVEIAEFEGEKQERQPILDFKIFGSNLTFALVTITLFAIEFVIFGATGLFPTYTKYAGYPPDTSFYVISVMNGASSLGRTLPGLAGDYLGPFNILICMIAFTLLNMLTLWIPFGGTNLIVFYIFATLWGFGTGSFISLGPVCIGKTCQSRDFGRYYGTSYFVVGFSLLITAPVGGHMLQTLGPSSLPVFYVGVLAIGGFCLLWARWSLLGGSWKWKVNA